MRESGLHAERTVMYMIGRLAGNGAGRGHAVGAIGVALGKSDGERP